MTILDSLITDRTREDAEQARELAAKGWDKLTPAERKEWERGLKGAYDYRDMNRVREAIEYIDRLMVDAKRGSVYEPVIIPHKVPVEFDGQGMVTRWEQWADSVWIDYDFPSPALWAAYLANINRLWAAARRFTAIVLPRYDPDGNGYIKPGTVVDAGGMFAVTDSAGLMELRITAACPPSVTASGTAWTVEATDTGWTAYLDYPAGPYPDINNALDALHISCGADGIVDGTFTLSAVLRYDYVVTAGTCAVRWSPFITWGEARMLYQTWGGTRGLSWDLAARGAYKEYAPYVPDGSTSYITSDGKVYCVWRYESGTHTTYAPNGSTSYITPDGKVYCVWRNINGSV